MSDSYTFKIERFTPETMPFGRLMEYYQEVRKLIRVDALHLVDLKKESLGSVFKIADEARSDVAQDLASVKDGTAPITRRRAAQTINQMLREDETSAAFLTDTGETVIAFPGMSAPVMLRTKAKAQFLGELYHISGVPRNNFARVRIETAAHGVIFCKTTVAMAKALRANLFEDIKVWGRGVWERSAIGEWSISDFEIEDFMPVKRETLRDALDDIRDLNIKWPTNSIEDFKTLREDSTP